MLIYSTYITARLRYTCDLIGREFTGRPFEVTDQKDFFRQETGPRVNYSDERITAGEFWLQPHSLLFEKDIKNQTIDCFETNGIKTFFKTTGDYPFDIFAASFYLVSRYEEYLPHQKDMYGRYAHENSVAYRENFLDLPLVNTWLQNFGDELRKRFSSFTIDHSSFTFLPTYDIDEAYSFKYKQGWRMMGAAARDLITGNWKNFFLRRRVLNGKEKDPFDSFDGIKDLNRQYKMQPLYFFLVAERTGRYDKNILPRVEALQQIIQKHACEYEAGIHPSWQSGDDPGLIKKEISTIEKLAGRRITSSRQHFIRFTLPRTFRYLIDAGISKDFSMGYGSINGFRASIASPFYWYDLEREEQTGLLLYPFCYMEANSFFEQKFTPSRALDEMRQYHKAVKAVNGTLITIWHNTFLGTDKLFEGWREVYEQFLEEVHGQAENVRPD